MIFRRYLLLGVVGLLILGFVINYYFVQLLIENSKSISKLSKFSSSADGREIDFKSYTSSSRGDVLEFVQEKVLKEVRVLPSRYFKLDPDYKLILESIFSELEVREIAHNEIPHIVKEWPSARIIVPPHAPELGAVIESLRSLKIVKADNVKHGTQLKLMITFENDLKAVFKPQWYNRTTKLDGPVYFGKDRHNAEVVAFYLSLLLSMRVAPIALIRKLDLSEEVEKNATPELLSTLYKEDENTCFYGICHYCSPEDPICGTNDVLEGALMLWLPSKWKLAKHRNPWQRTYSKNRNALWEVDMKYCEKIKQSKTYSSRSSSRLLNLIDVAIFDFLIDNGDRHHYETFQGNYDNPAILLIDNGKSFGNPDKDHIDILAPLYQCCMISKSTWDRLKLFSGGSLSYSLKKLLQRESLMADVQSVMTNDHLEAIDRRLLTVFAIVEICLKENPYSTGVIIG
ncbi:hypothetical protein QAD02_019467 [Eretmocerus hayati]|uniref:Uncharacterized protein n=1 Tax=Eretmocerus hayati TaxID=131215 RepID=A0ACC2PJS2_9HYME|nr:hypothetical protein QAD02_019467 [Eretmocerus hayati]